MCGGDSLEKRSPTIWAAQVRLSAGEPGQLPCRIKKRL